MSDSSDPESATILGADEHSEEKDCPRIIDISAAEASLFEVAYFEVGIFGAARGFRVMLEGKELPGLVGVVGVVGLEDQMLPG